ncbi:MAG: hypothetical protein F4X03_01355 [Dehalococcoidia bacterium]|nr:hypothetical protein [Dehalococcoidia bacterium]
MRFSSGGFQAERVDQAPVAHVAHDRPADLEDLLLGVVLRQLVEQLAVDVGVVDEQPLGVVERRLLSLAEVLVTPRRNLADGALLEGVTFP